MKTLRKVVSIFMIMAVVAVLNQNVVASKGKVNINTATKKELITLKHIGDKLADRIIEYRKAHPFKKSEEIMQVKGIGQKVYDANKSIITVKNE